MVFELCMMKKEKVRKKGSKVKNFMIAFLSICMGRKTFAGFFYSRIAKALVCKCLASLCCGYHRTAPIVYHAASLNLTHPYIKSILLYFLTTTSRGIGARECYLISSTIWHYHFARHCLFFVKNFDLEYVWWDDIINKGKFFL